MSRFKRTLVAGVGIAAFVVGGFAGTRGLGAEEAQQWKWYDAWTQCEDSCYGPGTSGPACMCSTQPPIIVEG